MKNNHFVSIFIILVISTAYIFSFTFFSTNVIDSFFGNNPLYPEGTKIASQDVSNKTRAESARVLEDAVKQWRKNTKLTFSYKEKEAEVDPVFYNFEPVETVQTIEGGQDNSVVVRISREALQEELSKVSPGLGDASIDYDRLDAELTAAAANLEISDYSYDLDQYVSGTEANEIISTAAVNLEKPDAELTEFVSAYPSIELQGKSIFSLLAHLEEEGDNSYSEETLSMVATALFGAALPTNFSVLERHISKELPAYSKQGYEAKVSHEENMDFVLSNENATPYTFELSYEANRLSVVLRGSPFLYRYEITAEEERVFEPKTVVQFDNSVPSGSMSVQKAGKNGQMIKLYRVIYDELGFLIAKELISDDFYSPIHRIVYQGLVVPPVTEPDSDTVEELPEEEEADEGAEEGPVSEGEAEKEEPAEDGTGNKEDGKEEAETPDGKKQDSAGPPLSEEESK